jgi:hypothetical protein
VLDAIAGEGFGLIEFVNGFVEFPMRLAKLMRHHVNVVEIGEG